MIFPDPDQSRLVEKQLDPAARADLARLRRLCKHAISNQWLDKLDMDKDRALVMGAVLEDLGATHVEVIACDVRIHGDADGKGPSSFYHRAYGFRVSDGRRQVFIGLKGERDMDLAEKRSVRREFFTETWERTSTWDKFVEEPGFEERSNPRNYPLGRQLVDEGVSLLRAHALAKATPSAIVPRKGPRL